jgi:hypothetical protein
MSLTRKLKEFQLKLEAILKEFLEQGSIDVYGSLPDSVAKRDICSSGEWSA